MAIHWHVNNKAEETWKYKIYVWNRRRCFLLGLLFKISWRSTTTPLYGSGRTQSYLPHHRFMAWKCKITKSPAFETKYYGHHAILLYKNIDQILPNKLHEPMYYKIGVTCIYNGHMFYTFYHLNFHHAGTHCWTPHCSLFLVQALFGLNSIDYLMIEW